MKFLGLLIIFFVGVQIQVWSQHVEALSACSDKSLELKVTDIFEASTLKWSVLNEAIYEEMDRDVTVFVMGEDVALYGGIFKVTEGGKK